MQLPSSTTATIIRLRWAVPLVAGGTRTIWRRRLWLLLLLVAPISKVEADTIDDIVSQVSTEQIRIHLSALATPRDTPAAQAAAANYILSQLQSYGYTPTQDPVSQSANLIVQVPGERAPEIAFVVGAHFDSVRGSPGADDNAASVAGLLEMARVLADQPLASSIELVAFAAEEEGLVGSRHYAQTARAGLREISGMLSLEMIAYTCTRPGCQFIIPAIRGCLQIDHPVPNVGTFITGVGNEASSDLLDSFRAAASRYVPQLSVNNGQVAGLGGCLPDTGRSDHAPFWGQDYPALMITDTANFRNPNYHKPSDTIETLDLSFATQVTQAALATALRVAGLASDPMPTPTPTRRRTPVPTATPLPPGAHVLLYAGVIIDTTDQHVVGRMPVTGQSIAAAPDGRSLYVTHWAGSSEALSVIDTATNLVVSSIGVVNSRRVAATPDGRFAYVTTFGDWPSGGSIVVIDATDFSIVATIPLEETYPGGLAFSAGGQFLYFTDPSRSTLSVIATATNSVVASFAVGRSFSAFGSNIPLSIAFAPDGALAYVANSQSATVSVIDTATNSMVKNVLVHQNPGDILIAPDGATAYVAVCCSSNAHQLDVIDTALKRVTATIDLPATASALAITPDGRFLYVASCPHIFIIDTTTNTIANILYEEGCAAPIAIAAVAELPPLTPYPTRTPSLTPLPTTPSPTAAPTVAICAGDCDGDGAVIATEILAMVNSALGRAGSSTCAIGSNLDATITVDEIIAAVNSAGTDCGRLPTVTATPTFGGCLDVCDGRVCRSQFSGTLGTCSGVGEAGCECVPYNAAPTVTATPEPAGA